jgi:hypothetical protein
VTSSFEAYGLVASEASVFGLPILVSDRVGCIGPRDTAEPGRNAIVFPCGDTGKPLNCYNDRSLCATMSSNSTRISESQDEFVATQRIVSAVRRLHDMGPRRLSSGTRQQLPSEAAPL